MPLQLAQDLEGAPASRVPDAPNDYVARVKDLVFSVFLPQYGPLNIPRPDGQGEVAPRSRAWDLLPQELRNSPHPTWNRPVCEIHDASIEVITSMAKNEFPLSAPPRWAAEFFPVLSHIVTLKMKSEKTDDASPD